MVGLVAGRARRVRGVEGGRPDGRPRHRRVRDVHLRDDPGVAPLDLVLDLAVGVLEVELNREAGVAEGRVAVGERGVGVAADVAPGGPVLRVQVDADHRQDLAQRELDVLAATDVALGEAAGAVGDHQRRVEHARDAVFGQGVGEVAPALPRHLVEVVHRVAVRHVDRVVLDREREHRALRGARALPAGLDGGRAGVAVGGAREGHGVRRRLGARPRELLPLGVHGGEGRDVLVLGRHLVRIDLLAIGAAGAAGANVLEGVRILVAHRRGGAVAGGRQPGEHGGAVAIRLARLGRVRGVVDIRVDRSEDVRILEVGAAVEDTDAVADDDDEAKSVVPQASPPVVDLQAAPRLVWDRQPIEVLQEGHRHGESISSLVHVCAPRAN